MNVVYHWEIGTKQQISDAIQRHGTVRSAWATGLGDRLGGQHPKIVIADDHHDFT